MTLEVDNVIRLISVIFFIIQDIRSQTINLVVNHQIWIAMCYTNFDNTFNVHRYFSIFLSDVIINQFEGSINYVNLYQVQIKVKSTHFHQAKGQCQSNNFILSIIRRVLYYYMSGQGVYLFYRWPRSLTVFTSRNRSEW